MGCGEKYPTEGMYVPAYWPAQPIIPTLPMTTPGQFYSGQYTYGAGGRASTGGFGMRPTVQMAINNADPLAHMLNIPGAFQLLGNSGISGLGSGNLGTNNLNSINPSNFGSSLLGRNNYYRFGQSDNQGMQNQTGFIWI